MANDGVEAEQRLDEVALEPVVQHFACRQREQIEQQPLMLQRKPAQDVAALQCVEGFAQRVERKSFRDVGGRAQQELPQHVGDDLKFTVESVDVQRIVLVQFCDRLMGAPLAGEQIAAIGGGKKILRAPLDDAQAMAREIQLGDHAWVQQAHGVGRDRIAEAGVKLLRHGCAAHNHTPLDDFDREAVHREIGRAGEAIMAGADDDRVVP
ncbi:hypothetical protein BN961_00665 [Afipia felis]|uniref:Uncharacterized protein n=1 Tax=Afipia felis TaxID=1035 RepID=A0A090N6Q8_AFIFE|nr:hypothetical protein BN961_00665 [Afipia felis]